MRQGSADVSDDRRHLVECDCPADVGRAGDQDLALFELVDAAHVVDHADGSGDDACSARKAFDVGGCVLRNLAAADTIIVSPVRVCHPFIGVKSACYEAREARVGEVSCEVLLAGWDVCDDGRVAL